MRDKQQLQAPGLDAPAAIEASPPSRAPLPLAMLAAADVATRGRVLAQLQRSAGNRAVAAAVQREPAPAAADTGVVPMLQGFFPDSAWSGGRLALDLMRPVPGLGMLTGFAADVMGAIDDWNAVPADNPMFVSEITTGLIVLRSVVNIVVNGAQSLSEIDQLLQWAGTALAGSEAATGVAIPAAIVTAIGDLGTFAAGEALSGFIAEFDGILAMIDALITIDAAIWGQVGPVGDREKWKQLAYGYLANTLGDLATLAVTLEGMASLNYFPSGAIAQAIDSLTALIKYVEAPSALVGWLLKSFWNVRGGNVLPHVPGTGPPREEGLKPREPQPGASEVGFGAQAVARTPADASDPSWAIQLAAAQACFERGESALAEAAGGWAELLEAGAAMAESTAGAPEALEAIRAQLPEHAEALKARLAAVEGLAGQLDVERLDAFSGHVDALLAGLEGLELPLDQAPEALLPALQPLADALDGAKQTLIEPLRRMQATLAELRPQLAAVAAAAQDSVALITDAIDRVTAAVAECDDMSAFVNDLAAAAASLASGDQDVPIGAALEDWRALGSGIQAAQAAL